MTIAKYDALTEDQWKKVKESLADVSVDADTVMVEWNRPIPLREALPRMAAECDFGRGKRGGFGIQSCDVNLASGGRGKGYKRAQFEEAWTRYLPPGTEAFSGEGGE
jgi:hypothetical protein